MDSLIYKYDDFLISDENLTLEEKVYWISVFNKFLDKMSAEDEKIFNNL